MGRELNVYNANEIVARSDIVVGGRHNPFRVGDNVRPVPRVARSSQPWALLRNPFGIHCSLRQARIHILNPSNQNRFAAAVKALLRANGPERSRSSRQGTNPLRPLGTRQ